MPQTIEQLTLTTLVLVVALVACTLAAKRWGTDEDTDALVVLWRRWAALGRPQTTKPRPAAKRPAPKRKPAKPPPPRKPAKTPPPPKPAPTIGSTSLMKAFRRDRKSRPPAESATVPPPDEQIPEVAEAEAEHDELPLSDAVAARDDETADGKVVFRQRFRRGLRKTRDYLNRDVREVFGQGPIPKSFDRLEEILVAADVGVATATEVVDELRGRTDLSSELLPEALRGAMVGQLASTDRRLRLVRGKLSVWIVVGVNGTGKTTTIAKLAARAKTLGRKVCLAAADTYRAAGIEQLAEWAERIGVDIVRQGQGADPGAVAFDAIAHARSEGHDLVIVDTAGRLHTRKPLMDELNKIVRVVEREEDAVLTECLLVVDSTTGQNGITQARAFKEAAGVTGLVLAKLDGTAKGGIVFAVERELGVAVKAVGVGEKERDLIPFDPEAFVDALLGPGEEN